ncbi:MAG: C40 family peptidase [Crocinitomicaceae bacterium]|nr:C40 family peptidase [Crocinitomicaceae bacterium]
MFVILTSETAVWALPEDELRDSIVCFASDHLGIPYHYGGTTTAGFDCTGFVYFVFKHFGITASRASSGYENAGEYVEKECARPGDVILFTGTNSEIRKVGHAGIIYENSNGVLYFIHSSSSKNHFGVTITQFNSSAGYQKRFLRIINIL